MRMRKVSSAGQRAQEEEQAPAAVLHQGGRPWRRQDGEQQGGKTRDDGVEADGEQGDEQEADVGGRADEAGHERPRLVGEDFHDQGHAQGPLAAHAEGRQETKPPICQGAVVMAQSPEKRE